jgi:hypothetical protein
VCAGVGLLAVSGTSQTSYMTLRSPSEKLESNAIKKFKTGKLLPNWPLLAATALARSGRNPNGSMWPQIHNINIFHKYYSN